MFGVNIWEWGMGMGLVNNVCLVGMTFKFGYQTHKNGFILKPNKISGFCFSFPFSALMIPISIVG